MELEVSIGIPAYNEEKNIGKLLYSLIRQKTSRIKIREIIVVSSGSTDRTDDIVRRFEKKDRRIRLLTQPYRMGKVSAINVFLKEAECNICVLESADTLPALDTVEKLCLPFYDSTVGMTGAHIIPLYDHSNTVEYYGYIIWKIHHILSCISNEPKLGEMIAFRKDIVGRIPEDVIADEAYIQASVLRKGYRVIYVRDAICFNKVPQTIRELINQRRRVFIGHLDLKHRFKYEVPTLRLQNIVSSTRFLIGNELCMRYLLGASIVELISRAIASLEFYCLRRTKRYIIWDIIKSTKVLKA